MANERFGKFILRVALGAIVLMHGIAKLQGGVEGISGMLTSHGLPAVLGYAVYIGEVLAPLMLILGFYARVGAVLVAINMLVALYLVHLADIFTISKQGGWAIEFQALLLFSAIAVALLGPGKPAINEY